MTPLSSTHLGTSADENDVIEQCAELASNLGDCSGGFIAERIRALKTFPVVDRQSEGEVNA